MKSRKQFLSVCMALIMTLTLIKLPFDINNASAITANTKSPAKTTTTKPAPVKKSTPAPAKPQIFVSGLGKILNQGQYCMVKVYSNNKKNVQYKVALLNVTNKKTQNITNGYTKSVPGKAYQNFKLPTTYSGKFILYIYMKEYNGKSDIAAWHQGFAINPKKVVVKENNDKDTKDDSKGTVDDNKPVEEKERVYSASGFLAGSEDPQKPENIKVDVKVKAENITLRNAALDKDLYVDANNARIVNLTAKGNIYLNPGKDGNVFLENVSAASIKVLSGGVNSIHFNNVSAKDLQVSSSDKVRVVTEGKTSIDNTNVASSAILENTNGSFGNIEIKIGTVKDSKPGENTALEGSTIEFKGVFEKPIVVKSDAVIKSGKDSSISKIDISPEVPNSKITLDGSFKSVEVNKESSVTVTSGTNITQGVVITTKTELNVSRGASVNTVTVNVDKNQSVSLNGEIAKVEIKSDSTIILGKETLIKDMVVNGNLEIVAAKTAVIENNVKNEGNKEIKVTGEGAEAIVAVINKDSNSSNNNQNNNQNQNNNNQNQGNESGNNNNNGNSNGSGNNNGNDNGNSNGGNNNGGNIPVIIPVTSIALDNSSIRMQKGTNIRLSYNILPINASTKTVYWSSSDTSVAEVSPDGTITAKAVGKSIITVRTQDGNKIDSCEVTVVDSNAKLMSINYVTQGEKVSFTVTSNFNDIAVDVISMYIYDSKNSLVYTVQADMTNGVCRFDALLGSGTYKVVIGGIYLGKETISELIIK